MRRVSGLKVARIAKSKNPPIPVFIVSAYAESLSKSSWSELPDRIFPKPLDKKSLFAALEDIKLTVNAKKQGDLNAS